MIPFGGVKARPDINDNTLIHYDADEPSTPLLSSGTLAMTNMPTVDNDVGHPCIPNEDGRLSTAAATGGLNVSTVLGVGSSGAFHTNGAHSVYGWISPTADGGIAELSNSSYMVSGIGIFSGEILFQYGAGGLNAFQTQGMGINPGDIVFFVASVCPDAIALTGAPDSNGNYQRRNTSRISVTVYNKTQNYCRTEGQGGFPPPDETVPGNFPNFFRAYVGRNSFGASYQGLYADIGWADACRGELWACRQAANAQRCFDEETLMRLNPEDCCFPYPKALVRASMRATCEDPWISLSEIPGNDCLDMVVSADWTCSESQPLGTAKVSVASESFGRKFSPCVENSFQEVADCGAQIKIETLLCPGNEPVDHSSPLWEEQFRGFVDQAPFTGSTTDLTIADSCSVLRDMHLERSIYFGSLFGTVPATTGAPHNESYHYNELTTNAFFTLSEVIQSMADIAVAQMNVCLRDGVPPFSVAPAVPCPPRTCEGFTVYDPDGVGDSIGVSLGWFTNRQVPVLTEMNRIAGAVGTQVRCKFVPETGKYALTIRRIGGSYEDGDPPIYEFNEACLHNLDLAKDCADVRTKVTIKWGPESTGLPLGFSPNALGQEFRANEAGQAPSFFTPAPPEYLDRVKRYGLRHAVACEDSETSPVQDLATANDLAERVYKRSAFPAVFGSTEMPYFPKFELGDVIQINGSGKRIDVGKSLLVCVSEVAHTMSGSRKGTRLRFRQHINGIVDGLGGGDGPGGGDDGP